MLGKGATRWRGFGRVVHSSLLSAGLLLAPVSTSEAAELRKGGTTVIIIEPGAIGRAELPQLISKFTRRENFLILNTRGDYQIGAIRSNGRVASGEKLIGLNVSNDRIADLSSYSDNRTIRPRDLYFSAQKNLMKAYAGYLSHKAEQDAPNDSSAEAWRDIRTIDYVFLLKRPIRPRNGAVMNEAYLCDRGALTGQSAWARKVSALAKQPFASHHPQGAAPITGSVHFHLSREYEGSDLALTGMLTSLGILRPGSQLDTTRIDRDGTVCRQKTTLSLPETASCPPASNWQGQTMVHKQCINEAAPDQKPDPLKNVLSKDARKDQGQNGNVDADDPKRRADDDQADASAANGRNKQQAEKKTQKEPQTKPTQDKKPDPKPTPRPNYAPSKSANFDADAVRGGGSAAVEVRTTTPAPQNERSRFRLVVTQTTGNIEWQIMALRPGETALQPDLADVRPSRIGKPSISIGPKTLIAKGRHRYFLMVRGREGCLPDTGYTVDVKIVETVLNSERTIMRYRSSLSDCRAAQFIPLTEIVF